MVLQCGRRFPGGGLLALYCRTLYEPSFFKLAEVLRAKVLVDGVLLGKGFELRAKGLVI